MSYAELAFFRSSNEFADARTTVGSWSSRAASSCGIERTACIEPSAVAGATRTLYLSSFSASRAALSPSVYPESNPRALTAFARLSALFSASPSCKFCQARCLRVWGFLEDSRLVAACCSRIGSRRALAPAGGCCVCAAALPPATNKLHATRIEISHTMALITFSRHSLVINPPLGGHPAVRCLAEKRVSGHTVKHVEVEIC